MDFELGEELILVRDMAREFATRELLPRAAKHDRQGFIDPEVIAGLAELGLMGLTIPEAYGGAGMSSLALSVVLEEINAACAATGVMLSVSFCVRLSAVRPCAGQASRHASRRTSSDRGRRMGSSRTQPSSTGH